MTAREAALTALERCRRDGAWSGSSIDGIIKKYALDRREAALAARLVVDAIRPAGPLAFQTLQNKKRG